MFFGPRRTLAVREMILAEDPDERRRALERIEPMQRQDFVGIFRALDGRPVTVRLLDPPLHEFLPTDADEIAAMARDLGAKPRDIARKIEAIREQNPMLGHRGCRLGLSYPEIYQVQVQALFHAACDVLDAEGTVLPEVMVPLVMEPEELRRLRALVVDVAHKVLRKRGHSLPVVVGTMIELPRAALLAGEIAPHADFFSFGTNDLTQTTMGLSRDDAGRFLSRYLGAGILACDPFESIDTRGVGRLVEMATAAGRAECADLKIGVCGEHGGDPASIRFFHRIGLDYVSCSPFRVPVARLAGAHAVVGGSRQSRRLDSRGLYADGLGDCRDVLAHPLGRQTRARGVEQCMVGEAFPLAKAVAYLLRSSGGGDGVDHFVADRGDHRFEVAASERLRDLFTGIAPAVRFENRVVDPGGVVEGDLIARLVARLLRVSRQPP